MVKTEEQIISEVNDIRIRIIKAQNFLRNGKLIDAERYLTFALNCCEITKDNLNTPPPIFKNHRG